MVRFISYNGEYPALCKGSLVLEINGETIRFGEDIDDNYESFWTTGGEAVNNKTESHVYKRPWRVDQAKLPPQYVALKKEIEDALNNGVPWGCCGGCLCK